MSMVDRQCKEKEKRDNEQGRYNCSPPPPLMIAFKKQKNRFPYSSGSTGQMLQRNKSIYNECNGEMGLPTRSADRLFQMRSDDRIGSQDINNP
jgi:hypothetical protein